MYCGCQIDVDYDNGPSAFQKKDRRAITEHVCVECGCLIKVGETYRYESGIWNGGPNSYKTCADCISLRDTFFCGFIYGELQEALSEHISESSGEVLISNIAKLTGGAKSLVFGMVEQLWEDFYLEYPTQPALRLEGRIIKSPHSWKRPDWINQRVKEMLAMDEAVYI